MERRHASKYHSMRKPSENGDPRRQVTSVPKQWCVHSLLQLFGPFRPLFGGHTIAEAGGSVLLPTTVLLVYRLLCTCGFVFTLVLYAATGDFRFARYGVWVYLGASIAMSCATFSSLSLLLFPDHSAEVGSSRSFSLLANITVPIYQIFFTLAITASILFWSFLRESGIIVPHLLLYGGSAVLMLVDSLFSARMNFRFSYVFIGEVLPSLWLVFTWTRFAVLRSWVYNGLDPSHIGASRIVFFHITFLTVPPILGVILLCTNRISPVPRVAARLRSMRAEKETTSVPPTEDLRVLANADLYADLAVATAKSADFISVSAPLPIYHPPELSREQYTWYP